MKFQDGFWLLKSGVKAYYGLQVVQAVQEGDGYNLQVSTKPIRHRGDTLGGAHSVDFELNDMTNTHGDVRSRPKHQSSLSDRRCCWCED